MVSEDDRDVKVMLATVKEDMICCVADLFWCLSDSEAGTEAL